MGSELTDATIPAEAGQWLIDASVSFTKGCYTGQELVARVDSRGGNVPRPVRGLVSDGDQMPTGATLHLGPDPGNRDRQVATVTRSARSPIAGTHAPGLAEPRGRQVGEGQRLEE